MLQIVLNSRGIYLFSCDFTLAYLPIGMAIFYGSTNSGKTETVIGRASKYQPFFGDKSSQQSYLYKFGYNDATSPNGNYKDSLFNTYGILGKTASELCKSQSVNIFNLTFNFIRKVTENLFDSQPFVFSTSRYSICLTNNNWILCNITRNSRSLDLIQVKDSINRSLKIYYSRKSTLHCILKALHKKMKDNKLRYQPQSVEGGKSLF